MSGIKPLPLTEFYRSLHARGETTETLARRLEASSTLVSRLITLAKPRRGRLWAKLERELTDRERELLHTVAKSSAWNMRQKSKRKPWNAAKVADLAETYRGRFTDELDRLRNRQIGQFGKTDP